MANVTNFSSKSFSFVNIDAERVEHLTWILSNVACLNHACQLDYQIANWRERERERERLDLHQIRTSERKISLVST